MKKCNECNIDVNSIRKTCPLCGQLLKADKEKSIDYHLYPQYLHTEKKANLVLRIFLFISLVVILVSMLINLLTYNDSKSLWSLYVILGVWYGWVLLRYTILSRLNIAGRLLLQMISISLIVIGVEKVSKGSGWALEYVIPFICIITTDRKSVV